MEIFRALERLSLSGALGAESYARKRGEAMKLLRAVSLVRNRSEITRHASANFGIPVRALDAIHIGCAEWLTSQTSEPLVFWTHDARQAQAAQSRGLEIQGV